jgi:hypothetical protein
MKEKKIPGWAGPLVGTGVGAILGAVLGYNFFETLNPPFMAICTMAVAAVGFLAGAILWLMDTMQSGTREREDRRKRAKAAHAGECPHCGERVSADDLECRHCKAILAGE